MAEKTVETETMIEEQAQPHIGADEISELPKQQPRSMYMKFQELTNRIAGTRLGLLIIEFVDGALKLTEDFIRTRRRKLIAFRILGLKERLRQQQEDAKLTNEMLKKYTDNDEDADSDESNDDNLTIIELLEKYYSLSSENDSDYVPNSEDENSDETSSGSDSSEDLSQLLSELK